MNSYSALSTFNTCQQKYYYTYIEKLQKYFDFKANNPLVLGTALHKGIEEGFDFAKDFYLNNYPAILRSTEVYEQLKYLEVAVNSLKEFLEKDLNIDLTEVEFEKKLIVDDFIGFIDLYVPNLYAPSVDIYDFKYSDNKEYYVDSHQLEIYRELLQRTDPYLKINKLGYIFIHKKNIIENIQPFISVEYVQQSNFNASKYINKLTAEIDISNHFNIYTKNYSEEKCKWCDFKELCTIGSYRGLERKKR